MTIFKTIFKLFYVLRWRWRTRHLERTRKNRTALRRQKVSYKGKSIMVMDYIRNVSHRMPPMTHNGIPVDHERMLREIYYKYDVKGLNFYIESMNENMRKTLKEKRKQKAK